MSWADSLHFNGHLPGGRGLAGTKISPVLHSRLYCHHQRTNTYFLQAECHSYCATNSVKALKGKYMGELLVMHYRLF